MYHIQTRTRTLTCGVLPGFPISLHDSGAWEVFDETALPLYLKEGAEMLASRILLLPDLSIPYDLDRVKELYFMLEALVDVRGQLSLGVIKEV